MNLDKVISGFFSKTSNASLPSLASKILKWRFFKLAQCQSGG